jgi:hypothetical protein
MDRFTVRQGTIHGCTSIHRLPLGRSSGPLSWLARFEGGCNGLAPESFSNCFNVGPLLGFAGPCVTPREIWQFFGFASCRALPRFAGPLLLSKGKKRATSGRF